MKNHSQTAHLQLPKSSHHLYEQTASSGELESQFALPLNVQALRQGVVQRIKPSDVLRLQRSIGNQAVMRLLNRPNHSASTPTTIQRVVSTSQRTTDIEIAKGLFDSYLTTHTIGQHIDAEANPVLMRQAQMKTLALMKFGMKGAENPEYWLTKGQDLLDKPMMKLEDTEANKGKVGKRPIWCDQATSIVVATLNNTPTFKSSLQIIKQGDPKQHGHWYVVANRAAEDGPPSYGASLKGTEFIIDIWGALRLNENKAEKGEELLTTTVFDQTAPAIMDARVFSEAEQYVGGTPTEELEELGVEMLTKLLHFDEGKKKTDTTDMTAKQLVKLLEERVAKKGEQQNKLVSPVSFAQKE